MSIDVIFLQGILSSKQTLCTTTLHIWNTCVLELKVASQPKIVHKST